MQRVAGQVQRVAVEPRRVELVRPELRRDAAVGGHRAVARGGDRDDDAGASLDRPGDLDAAPAQLARDELAGRVGAALADEAAPRRRAPPPTRRRSRPGRRRRRASSPTRSSSGDERPVEAHDHVEEQVAERRHAHRRMVAWTTSSGASSAARPLRSFALGGLVGAAGTIATARRLRGRSRRPRDAPAGLAAFEDAPCFLEVVEREAQSYREGGGEIDDRPVEARVAVLHEVRGGDHPQRRHVPGLRVEAEAEPRREGRVVERDLVRRR